MSFLRDLLSDLVEKRLWPLALLLVAALVAVPLVLAKSPSPDAGTDAPPAVVPTTPAPASTGASTAVPAVSLSASVGDTAPIIGHAKDPFRQQYLAKLSNAGASAPTSSAGSGGAPSTGHHTTPGTKQIFVTASVDVRFGKATGSLRTIKDVPRLTPLPSASNPVVIFLGMRADQRTAVFMVSSDVHAQGDGRCVPSVKECDAIELKEGDTAFLDVTGDSGRVTQYELDLVKVTLSGTTSKAKAKASYARVSKAGKKLLRRRAATSAVASGLRYSRRLGFLVPVPGTFLSGPVRPAADAPQALAGEQRAGWIVPTP